jgi:hypothetical protein
MPAVEAAIIADGMRAPSPVASVTALPLSFCCAAAVLLRTAATAGGLPDVVATVTAFAPLPVLPDPPLLEPPPLLDPPPVVPPPVVPPPLDPPPLDAVLVLVDGAGSVVVVSVGAGAVLVESVGAGSVLVESVGAGSVVVESDGVGEAESLGTGSLLGHVPTVVSHGVGVAVTAQAPIE